MVASLSALMYRAHGRAKRDSVLIIVYGPTSRRSEEEDENRSFADYHIYL